MARKKINEEELREQIRYTCVVLLSQKGIGFTLDEVAKELKISKKTIYKLFESKNAIFISIIDEMHDSIQDRQKELIEADLSPEEKLYQLLTIRVKYQEVLGSSHLAGFDVIAPEVYQYLIQAYGTGWNLVEQVLNDGIRDGHFRPFNVALVIEFLKHGMQMLHEGSFLSDHNLTYAEAEKQIIQIALCGIMVDPADSSFLTTR